MILVIKTANLQFKDSSDFLNVFQEKTLLSPEKRKYTFLHKSDTFRDLISA